jgi:hypothetical protein
MTVELPAPAPAGFLQALLERRIAERTGGRVRQLQVDVTDDRVHVQGHTSTYYFKQLAIQAILELRGVTEPRQVVVDIEVIGSDSGIHLGHDSAARS